MSMMEGRTNSDPDAHMVVIRHIRFNETTYGGWDEWSVACICGGLYEPASDRWFVPSESAAERLYQEHLRRNGISTPERATLEYDGIEQAEDTFGVALQTIQEHLTSVITSLATSMSIDDAFRVVRLGVETLEDKWLSEQEQINKRNGSTGTSDDGQEDSSKTT